MDRSPSPSLLCPKLYSVISMNNLIPLQILRMAEAASLSSGTMVESDIIAMKETLRAQQQLLQKLYAELDEEREASATAASEALDMILRLQGEKAAVKMEARQYERMAEEKLEHAETTLEIFEELMFQKDMEISSLENQVQACKRKLHDLGCDPNLNDFELQENNSSNNNTQLLQRTDEHLRSNSENGSVRRLHSLPPLPVNKNSLRAAKKRERSPSPHHHTDMIQTIEEEKTEKKAFQQSTFFANNSVESTHETLDSYWQQIIKLDEKVKEISDCKEREGDKVPNLRIRRHRSCSLFPRTRNKTISSISSDQVHHEVKQQNREVILDPSCSVNVHDVFEVPQPGGGENDGVNKHGKNRLERLRSDLDNRLTKPDPEVPEEKSEALSRYDSGKLMRILSTNMETKAHSPNSGGSNNNNNKITCMFGQKMEGTSVECNGEAEFHLLSKRIERLEKERERVMSSRQEITHEGDGEEQLTLLKEILSQVISMREEIVSSEARKSPPKDDGLLNPLQEAMLYFWI
ncbi:uncharacterized protein LOC129298089 isoform X2 [Prosopis cineraria]|uniref:uncharacterized protein LOC129298089 isoform X2 n=1 Tax=Prosopis cineraria TaxID=364024 RepID=UPI00240FDA8F|nr:uncharacterized protein LOC129298089 isoform X2 [Prosopis cineraria]